MGAASSLSKGIAINACTQHEMEGFVVAWAKEHESLSEATAKKLALLVFSKNSNGTEVQDDDGDDDDGALECIIKKRIGQVGIPNDDDDVREDWYDMEALSLIFEMLQSRMGKSKAEILLQCELGDVDTRTPSMVIDKPLYPMYVMPVAYILKEKCTFESLPKHSHALKKGLLLEVVENDDEPGNFHLYQVDPETRQRGDAVVHNRAYDFETFSNDSEEKRTYIRSSFLTISHQWLRPSSDSNKAHPDSVDNIKLRSLQEILTLNLLPYEKFVWMDYMSIPQSPGSEEQIAAIRSLPCYFMFSTSSIILCQNEANFRDTSKGYLSRGHCLLELASMRLPRIDTFGKWYVPGYDANGHWGTTLVVYMQKINSEKEIIEGAIQLSYKKLGWEDFSRCNSPLTGNFTFEGDRVHVKALLEKYMVVYDYFDRMFLKPMRTYEGNWDSYTKKNEIFTPQLRSTTDMWSDTDFTVKDMSEWLLPSHYPRMLHDSILKFENELKEFQ